MVNGREEIIAHEAGDKIVGAGGGTKSPITVCGCDGVTFHDASVA